MLRTIKRIRSGVGGVRGFLVTRLLKFLNSSSVHEIADESGSSKISSGNSGVYFIAFGEKYVSEALHCAKSIRNCSSLRVAICCDEIDAEAGQLFDEIIIVKPNHIRSKVDFLEKTPFDFTLYLDSDTEVVEDISDIFQLLNRFDVCMTHDFARKRHRWSKLIPDYDEIPDGYSEFGGGVILYRKDARSFIDAWKHYFYKHFEMTNGWDQASLRIASWHCENSIYVLPAEFNVRGQHVRDKTDKLPELEGGMHPLRHRIRHWHGLSDPDCDTQAYKY